MEQLSVISQYPFELRVDTWTRQALNASVHDFQSLLRILPGVYPTAVLASLRRLHKAGDIPAALFSRLQYEATDLSRRLPFDLRAPPPHPLNFEWRFTENSAISMLALASKSCVPNGEILLLGTPFVANAALELGLPQRIRFLGEDNIVTRALARESSRLGWPITMQLCGSPIGDPSADAVLIDPPWYEDYIAAMLHTAALACKVGGRIYFSLAPIGCSRSAIADRTRIIDFARTLGLKIQKIHPACLQYDTPFFEGNALRAAGIAAFPSWRRADLAVFAKVSEVVSQSDTRSLYPGVWRETMIGRMRLFVSANTQDNQGAKPELLSSILPNDILPSVSRRDPRRALANVWTSGNRIFKTDSPDLVWKAAQLATDFIGMPVENEHRIFFERRLDPIARLTYKLMACARLEEAEERGLFAEGRSCERDSNSKASSAGLREIRFG